MNQSYITTDHANKVMFIHNMPFDAVYGLQQTEAQLLQTGHLVESVPTYTDAVPEGKTAELHYDGAAFYWELLDKPLSPAEAAGAEIVALRARLLALEGELTATQVGLTELYETQTMGGI